MTSIVELRQLRRASRAKLPLLADGEAAVLHWMKAAQEPPLPCTVGWNRWPAVEEAHRRLMAQIVSRPVLPRDLGAGRGIVTLAGGRKYFVAGFVLVSLLRRLGCELPIEWWYLSPAEMDPAMIEIAQSLGNVQCVCAETQIHPRPRQLGGWEAKVHAIAHSRFQEVLFLDADQIPTRDPSYLFDEREYAATGAVFWPDLADAHDITPQAFRTAGLPVPSQSSNANRHRPDGYRPFETGQILVDKARHAQALAVCAHLNDHSEYWFPHDAPRSTWLIYGDKSTFLLAWAATRAPFAMPKAAHWLGVPGNGAIAQHDFQGRVVFHHKCQPPRKYLLEGPNNHTPDVAWQDQIDHILAHLRTLWSGDVWSHVDQSPTECRLSRAALGSWVTIGFDLPEIVELAAEGEIRDCGARWTIRGDATALQLVIVDDNRPIAMMANEGEHWIDRCRRKALVRVAPS